MTQYWRSHPTFFTGTVLVIAIFSSAFIDYFAGSTIAVLLILQLAVVAVALQCNANFAYFAAVFEATSLLIFCLPRRAIRYRCSILRTFSI